MSREVFTRDLSSGKVHRRIEVDGKYMSYEVEVIATLDNQENLCERCFPVQDTAPEDAA